MGVACKKASSSGNDIVVVKASFQTDRVVVVASYQTDIVVVASFQTDIVVVVASFQAGREIQGSHLFSFLLG